MKFLVYLTDETVSRIYNLAKILLERETIVVRQFASFIGLVINAFFAVLEAPLHYRNLERNKLMGLEATECIDRFVNKMILSTESKKDLQWWMDNVQKKNGKRIRPKNVDIFSSPEPLGSQGELIVYQSSRRPSVRPSSVRRRKQFQTSSSPKPLGRSKPNFMWSLLG